VPLETIVDALVAELRTKLAKAVETGRLTQEQADEKLAAAPGRITTKLESSGPLNPGHKGGHKGVHQSGGSGAATPRS